MGIQVEVRVAEHGSDAERRAQLASALRTELLALDDGVEHGRGGEVPPGARGIDATTAGVLVTSVAASVEVVTHLVVTVQAWLRRGGNTGERTVELTIGDCTMTVTGVAREQQDQLVEAFLSSVTRS